MAEIRITLELAKSGGRTWDIIGDPKLFEIGKTFKYGVPPEPYVVSHRTMFLDDGGDPRLVVALESRGRTIRALDRFARKHDFVVPVLAVLLLVIVAAGFIAGLLFLSEPYAAQLAWGGWAIANAPWVLFLGHAIGVAIASNRLSDRIGNTFAGVVGMTGATMGFVAAMSWRALFIPANPVKWPTDYTALALHFGQSTAGMIAVLSAYAPAILVALKLIGLDVIAPLVSLVLGKKGKD